MMKSMSAIRRVMVVSNSGRQAAPATKDKGASEMDLRFIRGNSAAPRGHAIIIVRHYGQSQRAMATYCIVLPITFSIGRYIPPILLSLIHI